MLAYGRHSELHFIQLSVDEERRRLRYHPLLRFQLDFNLRGLQWLDPRLLALLDSQQQVNKYIHLLIYINDHSWWNV